MTDYAHTLQRLVDAFEADQRAAGRRVFRDGDVGVAFDVALNAMLVVTGVRSACRLETYGRPPMRFMRCLADIGRKFRLVEWGGDDLEPLFVNTDLVDPADVELLVHARGGDLEPPIDGPMGRVLQYPCPPPKRGTAAAASLLVSLEARVQRLDDGRTITTRPAAFFCDSQAAQQRHAREKRLSWVAPALRALAGCEVTFGGRRYVVCGFDVIQTRLAVPRRTR